MARKSNPRKLVKPGGQPMYSPAYWYDEAFGGRSRKPKKKRPKGTSTPRRKKSSWW